MPGLHPRPVKTIFRGELHTSHLVKSPQVILKVQPECLDWAEGEEEGEDSRRRGAGGVGDERAQKRRDGRREGLLHVAPAARRGPGLQRSHICGPGQVVVMSKLSFELRSCSLVKAVRSLRALLAPSGFGSILLVVWGERTPNRKT